VHTTVAGALNAVGGSEANFRQTFYFVPNEVETLVPLLFGNGAIQLGPKRGSASPVEALLMIAARLRLSAGSTLGNLGMLFECDPARVSEVVSKAGSMIVEGFGYRIEVANLSQFVNCFPHFQRQLLAKFLEKKRALLGLAANAAVTVPGFMLRTAMHIDGMRQRVERPSGPFEVQKQCYTKYKDYAHNLVWTMVTGGGFILAAHEELGKHHDMFGVHLSNLDQTLEEIGLEHGQAYAVLGDNAFDVDSLNHIFGIPKEHQLASRGMTMVDSRALSSVRIAVEWTFGHLGEAFPFVGRRDKNTLFLTSPAKMLRAAILLYNAVVCIRGSESTTYFRSRLPAVGDYLQRE